MRHQRRDACKEARSIITTSGDEGYTTMSEASHWTLAQEVDAARRRTGTRDDGGMARYVTWIQTLGMTVVVTVDGVFREKNQPALCQFATPMPVAGSVSA